VSVSRQEVRSSSGDGGDVVQTRCGIRHVDAEACAPRLDRCTQAVARRNAGWAAPKTARNVALRQLLLVTFCALVTGSALEGAEEDRAGVDRPRSDQNAVSSRDRRTKPVRWRARPEDVTSRRTNGARAKIVRQSRDILGTRNGPAEHFETPEAPGYRAKEVPPVGIEPTTFGLKVRCSAS
jgi:hypothetical protein